MNFDKAVIKAANGQPERSVSAAEFLEIPLSERIQLLTGSQITFYRDGKVIDALEAVRRPKK